MRLLYIRVLIILVNPIKYYVFLWPKCYLDFNSYFSGFGSVCCWKYKVISKSWWKLHLLSISFHFGNSACQCQEDLVTDAAGKNNPRTSARLIRLQICLFLAPASEFVGSSWLQLWGWRNISKHLLPISDESHISPRFFLYSVSYRP